MTPEERSSLIAKREAAKQSANDKAVRAQLSPALEALDAAGAAYRLVGLDALPDWSPAWLGNDQLFWERHKHDVWEMFEPGDDFDQRRAVAAEKILRDLVCDAAELRIVYDGSAATLFLSPALALRHISALIAVPASSIWFSAPPHDWLLDVQRDQLFARKK